LRFHLDRLARAMRRAKLFVLASPHNPTGGVLAPEDIEQLVWWAHRRDVLILCDDVFERYRYEGDAVALGNFPKARTRTVVIGGVSKGYALAATRVGWLGGHRHLVRPCLLTALGQAPFVPTICQHIALTALRQGHEPFVPIRGTFESRRRYAFERLEGMGLEPDWPAGGFFFWVPVGNLGTTGRAFAEQLRQAKRVLVTPGDVYGPGGGGHIRLSYAAEDGRLQEGLGRMAEFLREFTGTAAPELLHAA
jgi:aspartate/methionine/tyrosine aminotransferase